MKIILTFIILSVSSITFANNQELDDPFFQQELHARGYDIQAEGLTWDVEPFQDSVLYDVFHTEDEIFNDVMMQTQTLHIGVPYVWGGNSWKKGIDCSHYTRKIYQDAGVNYGPYQVTYTLKKIKENKYFKEVSYKNAKPGDLMVYGYNSMFSKKWHGHIVILIDKHYRSSHWKKGLVSGAHGKVGVQFVSYNGFPNYYRYPFYKLRKILRVKDAQ